MIGTQAEFTYRPALQDDQLVADEFGLGSMQHNSVQKEEGANPLLSLTLMFGIMS